MQIKINYGGHTEPFPNVESTEEIRKIVQNVEGVQSADVRYVSQLSEGSGISTQMIIDCATLGLGIATFIYTLYRDRRSKNEPIRVQVNNQIVNISENDSLEQVQLKLQIDGQNESKPSTQHPNKNGI
ncbi:hypothetical protein HYX08_01880 [Candidatus Woesearchaeota archaeon]|nr:hypothetical protein [Candidatus Woesearchaeota archaeon]